MSRGLAFALAGPGGCYAHRAGVLKAAGDHGVVPDLVTATSGQIVAAAVVELREIARHAISQEAYDQAATSSRSPPGPLRIHACSAIVSLLTN